MHTTAEEGTGVAGTRLHLLPLSHDAQVGARRASGGHAFSGPSCHAGKPSREAARPGPLHLCGRCGRVRGRSVCARSRAGGHGLRSSHAAGGVAGCREWVARSGAACVAAAAVWVPAAHACPLVRSLVACCPCVVPELHGCGGHSEQCLQPAREQLSDGGVPVLDVAVREQAPADGYQAHHDPGRRSHHYWPGRVLTVPSGGGGTATDACPCPTRPVSSTTPGHKRARPCGALATLAAALRLASATFPATAPSRLTHAPQGGGLRSGADQLQPGAWPNSACSHAPAACCR